jgi:uncharacterized Tic20 family protein
MLTEVTITKEERTNAALAHGGIVLGIFSRGLLGILVAMLIWFTQRKTSRYVARQALQAAFYQLLGIGVAIAMWLGWALVFAGSIVFPLLIDAQHPEPMMPFTMIPALGLMAVPFIVMIGWTIYGIYAAWQVWHGHDFSYPVIGKWFK